MSQITILAPAKINLTLDVVGKRDDGYHDIESVMHQINLCDRVTVGLSSQGVQVITDNPNLKGGRDNLAYKAAEVVMARFGIKTGFRILIEKNIPLSAGLAGGSTNAAATIKAIDELLGLGISAAEMNELGQIIGSDVAFCIAGATAVARGRGEILTPVVGKTRLELVLINPGFPVSTARIFSLIDQKNLIDRPDAIRMVRALEKGNLDSIAAELGNVMEQVTLELHPHLQKIKDDLMEAGARGALMSGSGPTVFGVYSDTKRADDAFNRLKRIYPHTFRASSYFGNGDSVWKRD